MLKDMTDWPLCRRVPQNFGTKMAHRGIERRLCASFHTF